MPRILINECKQEISSFNPVPGRYEDFAIARGDDLLRLHRGIGTEVGGALQIFDAQPDVTLLPGYSCRAITSGGTLAEEAFHRITEEFLESVRAHRDADAIYFCLHGAFAAEGEPDIEGYLLEQTRAIVGERTPIVTSLDLHGIVTEAWSPIARGRVADDPTIITIANELGRTPAQVALRWAIQHDIVVIPKSVTRDRIGTNFEVFDFEIGADHMADIDALDDPLDGRMGPNPDEFNLA